MGQVSLNAALELFGLGDGMHRLRRRWDAQNKPIVAMNAGAIIRRNLGPLQGVCSEAAYCGGAI
jgi:hypothetical protein